MKIEIKLGREIREQNKIIINGVDISERCRGLKIEDSIGSMPVVTLELIPEEIDLQIDNENVLIKDPYNLKEIFYNRHLKI